MLQPAQTNALAAAAAAAGAAAAKVAKETATASPEKAAEEAGKAGGANVGLLNIWVIKYCRYLMISVDPGQLDVFSDQISFAQCLLLAPCSIFFGWFALMEPHLK